MNETTRRYLVISVVLVVALGATALGVWLLGSRGTASAGQAASPSPSPSITLRAADQPGQVARPADDASATPEPAAGEADASDEASHDEHAGDELAGGVFATIDDAAGQQAYDAGTAAVLATVTQLEGESPAQRRERLGAFFPQGSPTLDAAPAIDLAGIGVVSLGRVDTAGLDWAKPFDPGDGRLGFLVGVTAQTFGMREGGDQPTAWKDTSTQTWKVLLANDGAAWTPQVAYPADQDEPTGGAA